MICTMNNLMEKYKSGWILSVLRLDPSIGNRWYFLSPEEASAEIDYANLSPAKFKEIRPLIHQSQMISSTEAKTEEGLPFVSVYMHKNLSA